MVSRRGSGWSGTIKPSRQTYTTLDARIVPTRAGRATAGRATGSSGVRYATNSRPAAPRRCSPSATISRSAPTARQTSWNEV